MVMRVFINARRTRFEFDTKTKVMTDVLTGTKYNEEEYKLLTGRTLDIGAYDTFKKKVEASTSRARSVSINTNDLWLMDDPFMRKA